MKPSLGSFVRQSKGAAAGALSFFALFVGQRPDARASDVPAVRFRQHQAVPLNSCCGQLYDVYPCDVDGDGLRDLVSMGGIKRSGQPSIIVLRNLGGRSFSAPEYSPFDFPSLFLVRPADLDGDGDLDVVAVETFNSQREPGEEREVLLLRNDGRGHFSEAGRYPAGPHTLWGVPADFDADGDVDLAVSQLAWGSAHTLSVRDVALLLNRGDGCFEPPRMLPGIWDQRQIAAGDLDGDGLPEIVVGGREHEQPHRGILAILWNLSGGVFASPEIRVLPSAERAWSVDIGDLNADGAPEILAGHSNVEQFEILWNAGRGAFPEYSVLSGTYDPAPLRIADLNGDGHSDIVARAASVYFNRGDRTWRHDGFWAQGEAGMFFETGDVDGDGHVDLCFISGDDEGSGVSVLYNRGDGSFESARAYRTSGLSHDYDAWRLNAIVSGDFDADGDVDLAVANCLEKSGAGVPEPFKSHVFILKNRGDGTFEDGGRYGWPSSYRDGVLVAFQLAAGDFDGDGDWDLIVSGGEAGGLLLSNRGDGSFSEAGRVFTANALDPGSSAFETVARDFDGDGDLDLAVLVPYYGNPARSLGVFWNGRTESFTGPTVIPVSECEGRDIFDRHSLVSSDFDGDGDWDLAFAAYDSPQYEFGSDAAVWVARNDGGREFTLRRAWVASKPAGCYEARIEGLACGDMDGDGAVDLVAGTHRLFGEALGATRYEGAVEVVLGNGRGGFGGHQKLVVGRMLGPAVYLGDADGDGDLDVATGAPGLREYGEPAYWESIQVLFNDGTGRLGKSLAVNTDSQPVAVEIRDLNGDSRPDLAVASWNWLRVDVFLNEASGAPPGRVGAFIRGDANGDGALGITDPVVVLNWLFLGGASLPCEKTADADDDGVLRLTDTVYVLNYLFFSGIPPAEPFPLCGHDPTEDLLPCAPRVYCP